MYVSNHNTFSNLSRHIDYHIELSIPENLNSFQHLKNLTLLIFLRKYVCLIKLWYVHYVNDNLSISAFADIQQVKL